MDIRFTTQDQTHFIAGPAGALELVLRGAGRAGAEPAIAVICHPHPLHGGTMDNKVVTTLARTYLEQGIDTVRFNFRGVGQSQGEHGYLEGEVADLQAVIDFLGAQFPGRGLLLAGFSFGSAVAARCAEANPAVTHLLLIAPPVGKYDLSFPQQFPCRTLVVQGDQDEVVDLHKTRAWAATGQGDFSYLEMPGVGHFFHGQLVQLADEVGSELQRHAKEQQ